MAMMLGFERLTAALEALPDLVVITKMVVVNCSYIEIVIGGHPPNITVKNTTGCTITLCPEFMDHEIESLNAAGVALQAVPRDAISPLQVRALGCA